MTPEIERLARAGRNAVGRPFVMGGVNGEFCPISVDEAAKMVRAVLTELVALANENQTTKRSIIDTILREA